MKVHVLKHFPFSRDGIVTIEAVPPSADVPDALVAGLEGAGYVRRVAPGAGEDRSADLFRRGEGEGASGLPDVEPEVAVSLDTATAARMLLTAVAEGMTAKDLAKAARDVLPGPVPSRKADIVAALEALAGS
jgi:hypothetical protein